MQEANKPAPIPNSAPSTQSRLTDAAQRAWAVNFVVPTPPSMPSQRLKARADLVRRALSCNVY